jgi:hypothetical protein
VSAPAPEDTLRIHIPPAAEHVQTVRAFVAAAGRHAGCPEETIDDLRVVVTETCAQAFEEGTAPDGIEVRATVNDDALWVEVVPAARFVGGGGDPLDPTTGQRRRTLIQALFPTVELIESDGAPVLRVRVPRDGDLAMS